MKHLPEIHPDREYTEGKKVRFGLQHAVQSSVLIHWTLCDAKFQISNSMNHSITITITAALAAISEAALSMNDRIEDVVSSNFYRSTYMDSVLIFLGKPSTSGKNAEKFHWKRELACSWQSECNLIPGSSEFSGVQH